MNAPMQFVGRVFCGTIGCLPLAIGYGRCMGNLLMVECFCCILLSLLYKLIYIFFAKRKKKFCYIEKCLYICTFGNYVNIDVYY